MKHPYLQKTRWVRFLILHCWLLLKRRSKQVLIPGSGWRGLVFTKALEASVLCLDKPLQALMDKYLLLIFGSNGLPLYASVFGEWGFLDIAGVLAAETGLTETPVPILFIFSLPRDYAKNVLLASAALLFSINHDKWVGDITRMVGKAVWNRAQTVRSPPLLDAGATWSS